MKVEKRNWAQRKQPVNYSHCDVILAATATYNNLVAEKVWKGNDVLSKKTSKEEDPTFLALAAQVQELISKANSNANSNNNSNNNPLEGWKKS